MWLDLIAAMLFALPLTLLLATAVRWRAPGRLNTPRRSFLGFFLPSLLFSWGALAMLSESGPGTWGVLWTFLGALGVFVALLLADVASPPAPSRNERRRAARRSTLLDPVYFLYIATVGIGVLAAGVTRMAFAELA